MKEWQKMIEVNEVIVQLVFDNMLALLQDQVKANTANCFLLN